VVGPTVSQDLRTAVVIPVHNGRDGLARCLKALKWSAKRDDVVVIVADAGSTDGTAEFVRSTVGWAVLVTGPDTMWWTAATELGARYAFDRLDADRLCLLNHDCALDEAAFSQLAACQAAHPGDIVCAQVRVFGEDLALFQGGRVCPSGRLAIKGYLMSPEPAPPSAYVTWCGGMGVLVPRAVYEMVGGYDERRFPHYWADADFCLRSGRLGVGVWYCAEAVVFNDRSTTGLSVRREGASWAEFWRSLTQRKSAVNVSDTVAFYRRHLGARAPVALLHVYSVHLASSLRRIAAGKRGPREDGPSRVERDGTR
jgi:GT2 family glycosyltransferase